MSIEFMFRDRTQRAGLEQLCESTLVHFTLPDQSICCIFDDEERPELIRKFGNDFYGFWNAVRETGYSLLPWPSALKPLLFREEHQGVFGEQKELHDHVLYVRKRTCESSVGAVITFAHILQHLVTFTSNFDLWQECQRLRVHVLPKLDNAVPWHIPDEYLAELTAKRVANAVLRPQSVTGHATAQIEGGRHVGKWEFFRSLDTSMKFDLKAQTEAMLTLHSAQLEGSDEHGTGVTE